MCECKNLNQTGARSKPWLGVSKHGDSVWVCSKCHKPKPLYWEGFIETCLSCGYDFSAPFDKLCRNCSPNQPYVGWPEVKTSKAPWYEEKPKREKEG